MNILVTGASGFIGKNLIAQLRHKGYTTIFECDMDTTPQELDCFCSQCDFVFHLAGVNRPQNTNEFMQGNFGFTSVLLDTLKKHKSLAPVLITSSIQATLDNSYGNSKKAGEDLLFAYQQETGAKVFVYRLPNVFGKWCRPNYNSAVATFCHNIANDLPICVNNRDTQLELVYIDDVLQEFIAALEGTPTKNEPFYKVPITHVVSLGEIVDLLYSFKDMKKSLLLPDLSNQFAKKLHATYLSYLPVDQFRYPLKMNIDDRGSFTEIIRTANSGQFSVNISKPHIVKGEHWHHTKNEKFLVVSGSGVIRFRKIGDDAIIEYPVSGDKLEVVDIPTGYTHNIENTGEIDMVTFMWCNECFDPNNPDTMFEKV